MSTVKTCSCGARIVILRQGDDWRPVRAETVRAGERFFDSSKGHVNHFTDCPNRKRYQRKEGEHVPVYDEADLAAYRDRPEPRVLLTPPHGAGPELVELYQRAGELDWDRGWARALLDRAGITGNPLAWDLATIAAARAELERQAALRDQTIALLRRAALDFERNAA